MTPPEATTPPETTTPPPEPTPATETPTTETLDVTVTFDGETCTYVGPTVIPDGTMMKFEYLPDAGITGSYLMVFGVKPGTTFDMFVPGGVVSEAPDWVYQETASWTGGVPMLYEITRVKTGKDGVDYEVFDPEVVGGGYQVACSTPTMYPAAQLRVVS